MVQQQVDLNCECKCPAASIPWIVHGEPAILFHRGSFESSLNVSFKRNNTTIPTSLKNYLRVPNGWCLIECLQNPSVVTVQLHGRLGFTAQCAMSNEQWAWQNISFLCFLAMDVSFGGIWVILIIVALAWHWSLFNFSKTTFVHLGNWMYLLLIWAKPRQTDHSSLSVLSKVFMSIN